MSDTSEAVSMPTTIRELWDQGWVAENEDEAIAQAERMFDLFHGKTVRVDRLMFHDGDDYDEQLFKEPWPEVLVVDLDINGGWDGDVLYAEWYVRVLDPDQALTTITGEQYRLGDIDDGTLTTTPPGIGTAKGFARKDRLVFPIVADTSVAPEIEQSETVRVGPEP